MSSGARKIDHHEIDVHEPVIVRGSDRAFGFTMAAVSLVAGVMPLLGAHPARIPFVVAAIALAAVALVAPQILGPFALLWFRFGLLIHRVTGPVMLAAVYFLIITPTGLILRRTHWNGLRLRRDPGAVSYWIDRPSQERTPRTMQRQF
jgi:hypothetical protein